MLALILLVFVNGCFYDPAMNVGVFSPSDRISAESHEACALVNGLDQVVVTADILKSSLGLSPGKLQYVFKT